MKALIAILFLVVPACGGSTPDAPADFALAAGCGGQSCGAGESCCVTNYSGNGAVAYACAADCAAPAIAVQCNGAGDCSGGSPCCVSTKAGVATDVSCGAGPTDCAPMFGGGMGKTHTCMSDADCASSSGNVYTDCCHSTLGVMQHICYSANLVAASNGTVACP